MKRALLLVLLCGCATNTPDTGLPDDDYLKAYTTAAKEQAYESVGFLQGKQDRIHRDKLQRFYNALKKNPPLRSSTHWESYSQKCTALEAALTSAPDADGFITKKP